MKPPEDRWFFCAVLFFLYRAVAFWGVYGFVFSVHRSLRLRYFSRSLWRAYQRWNDAECVDLSAAFAYYTLQSIFPLLLIALAVAARLYGQAESLDNVLKSVSVVLPPSALNLVDSTLRGLVAQGAGAGVLGVIVLFLTASNAYFTLQRGADRLWDSVLPPPNRSVTLSVQIVDFLRVRMEAFMIILLISVFIVLGQIVVGFRRLPEEFMANLKSAIPGLTNIVHGSPVLPVVQVLVSALGLSLLIVLLLRVLPNRRVPTRFLVPGAVLISISLSLLNVVLGLSIVSLGNRYQAYGVIGGVLVLTLWVWLVGVIIYFGQCWSVELSAATLKSSQRG